jgi:hypothetical protein
MSANDRLFSSLLTFFGFKIISMNQTRAWTSNVSEVPLQKELRWPMLVSFHPNLDPSNRCAIFFNRWQIISIVAGKRVRAITKSLMRNCVLAMLGICFLGLPLFAKANEEKSDVVQYDQTIGDTRVVLLAISSVCILTSTNSTANNTPYLEISYLVEHVGTNTYATTMSAPVTLFLQGEQSPLRSDGNDISFVESGPACNDLPTAHVKVTNAKECHIHHFFQRGLKYPPSAKATCVIQDGFDGHLANFKFNGILLPDVSSSKEKTP